MSFSMLDTPMLRLSPSETYHIYYYKCSQWKQAKCFFSIWIYFMAPTSPSSQLIGSIFRWLCAHVNMFFLYTLHEYFWILIYLWKWKLFQLSILHPLTPMRFKCRRKRKMSMIFYFLFNQNWLFFVDELA